MPFKFTFRDLILAAIATTKALDLLGHKHCYIGGFAVIFLGGERPSADVDVLVGADPATLRYQIIDKDPQFQINSKNELVYKLEPHQRTGIATSVPVNIFRGGKDQPFKLPDPNVVPRWLYDAEEMDVNLPFDGDVALPFLHPVFLTISKLRSWLYSRESTAPGFLMREKVDMYDLHHMLRYTIAKDEEIDLSVYTETSKEELIEGFRLLCAQLPNLRDTVEDAMTPESFKMVNDTAPSRDETES